MQTVLKKSKITRRISHVRIVFDADGDGSDDLPAAVKRSQVAFSDSAVALPNDLVIGV